MKIYLHLNWVKTGRAGAKSFKSAAAHALVEEYGKRISYFAPLILEGRIASSAVKRAASKLWLCDRSEKVKPLSSEALAEGLRKLNDSGTRELRIVIGGPDGFAGEEAIDRAADFRWSFGPLTLPHELAAVVATEQIYRAYTILNRLPYHLGH